MGHRSDSSRLWRAILVLAVVVAALFVIDPFSSPGGGSADDDRPIVAILARDEVREDPDAPPEPDEVLGEVVVPDDEGGSLMSVTERGLRRLAE
jgi:hypothetical protein